MKRLDEMTLEEKIGQKLLFGWAADDADGPSLSEGYPGASPEAAATAVNARALRLLRDWKVGGIILMGRNVESPVQVAALHNAVQAECDVPVFFSTDQEGGHVCRMKKPFTMMPGAMPLGATRDAVLAERGAAAVSAELSAIGINLDFAPDADVNNNPDNPIIGVRSYGEDPALVARMVTAQVKGYQSNGTIACAKHFPGHGDTAVDSHLGLASLPWTMDRLRSVELPPFVAAIEAGVDFVMTAHIIFEAIDPDRPGTLSPKVVDGLLRGELGYQGVVITDCMEMKGVVSKYGIGEAAVMAVEAGVDVLAACHTPSRQEEIRTSLLEAVRSGRIPESRIDESVARILACKEKYGLDERRVVDVDSVMKLVGCVEHRALEQDIARKSITVVKDEAGRIPLLPGKTLVVGPPDQARTLAEEIASARLFHALDTSPVDHVGIGPAFTDDQLSEVASKSAGATAIVVLTKHKEPWTSVPQDEGAQAEMIKGMVAFGKPVVVVAIRNPYDIRHFPEAPTYLCTYGYTAASLTALAEVLVGAVEATGKLPVTLPMDGAAPIPAEVEEDTTKWGF
jgi:beta-N-acetylhexosaminidase